MHQMLKISKSLLLVSLSVFSVSSYSQDNLPDSHDYVTVIMDRTGSMQKVRPADGKSRCDVAKEQMSENIKFAIKVGKNIKAVAFGGNTKTQLSGGFVNTQGMSHFFGPGKAVFESIMDEVNAVSCSGGTPLGDVICEEIDILTAENAGGSSQPRIGYVTDAGENSSVICGGDNYVIDKIIPKAFAVSPPVRINVTWLSAPTGTLPFGSKGQEFDGGYEPEAKQNFRSRAASFTELQQWKILTQATGGSLHVISDNEVCTDCSSFENPSVGGKSPIGF